MLACEGLAALVCQRTGVTTNISVQVHVCVFVHVATSSTIQCSQCRPHTIECKTGIDAQLALLQFSALGVSHLRLLCI